MLRLLINLFEMQLIQEILSEWLCIHQAVNSRIHIARIAQIIESDEAQLSPSIALQQ
jgi:hypothetical protein